MYREIDIAKYQTSDPDILQVDYVNGWVSPETASTARGYDAEKEIPAAQEATAKRLALVAASQGGVGTNPGARGIKDAAPTPGGGAAEKAGKPQRGPAEGTSNGDTANE